MRDLINAKNTLIEGGFTLVLCKGDETVSSSLRGVAPLARMYHDGKSFEGWSAADKVVGKATAYLYVLLGVKKVFAGVMSRAALSVLKEHGVYAEYCELVPYIINRAGDGVCPFEAAVRDVNDPNAAFDVIIETMMRMEIKM